MNDRSLSLAIFGSAARGDSDKLSDRDIFVVGDSRQESTNVTSLLESSGWSPTVYTWRRLASATRRGDLFIQHLKHESALLKDPDDRLAHALAMATPRSSYKLEFDSACKLLESLEKLPQSGPSLLWALDVLFVAFRSAGIALLASEGRYVFSFRELLWELTRIGVVKPADYQDLRRLRRYKHAYRKRNWSSIPSWRETRDTIDLVARRLRTDIHIRKADSLELFERAMGSGSAPDAGWYRGAREIEAVLWLLEPEDAESYQEVRNGAVDLLRIVSAPSDYGWLMSRDLSSLRLTLRTLASHGLRIHHSGRERIIIGQRSSQ